jgi:hypothetical protein
MAGLKFETTPEEKAVIEATITAKLLAYARAKGISDPIVRDLIPNEDLKGSAEVGSGHIWQQSLSAFQYRTIYSGVNDKDRAFAIFKVANTKAKPLTAAIKFFDGIGRTRILDIWQVEHAWLNPDMEAYCAAEDAIFYGVEKGYNIDFLATESGMDNVILGGKVVEPRGKTITPAPR